MDEDIIEGEVVDSYDPREDPRIAFEVEDFQQHMDEMKQAYLFAADMISRGAFRPPPQPEAPQVPGKGRVAILMCGKVLIATGEWLVSKSALSTEKPSGRRAAGGLGMGRGNKLPAPRDTSAAGLAQNRETVKMNEQENKALQPYMPRALQRKVKRDTDLMKADAEVGKAVIDRGTELHDHAGEKMLESALYNDMLLKGAERTLNGTYKTLEEDMRQMAANHRLFVAQCVGQRMGNMLRRAEEGLPANPEVGLLARIGDGIAEARDELDRTFREG